MAITVRVTGDLDVRRKLAALSEAARVDVLVRALNAGAQPIIETAKRLAPPGEIPRGIQVVDIEIKRRTLVTAIVGLVGGATKWFHGLFVELGTGPRYQKNGRYTGVMPARPFLRPAFDAEQGRALDAFGDVLRNEFEGVARG